jgi:deoxyribonuclease V
VSLVCVDVDYRASCVVTAALAFEAWESDTASFEVVSCSDEAPAEYVPGSFYERELPYILAGLAGLAPVAGLAGLAPVAGLAGLAPVAGLVGPAALGEPAELPEAAPASTVIIDGYVWLGAGRPGLGAHLYQALGQRTAVVGVAKRRFHGAGDAVPILRGTSQVPLFVTAVGIDLAGAAEGVRRMHGAHRIPTLLKRVDRLSREGRGAHDGAAARR